MSFLHCRSCGWEQDDFWSKDGYNPFSNGEAERLRDTLFQGKVYTDGWFIKDLGLEPQKEIVHYVNNKYKNRIFPANEEPSDYKSDVPKEGYRPCYTFWVDSRLWVAALLERKAKVIRNMHVQTYAEWEKVKDTWKCPDCGSSDWYID